MNTAAPNHPWFHFFRWSFKTSGKQKLFLIFTNHHQIRKQKHSAILTKHACMHIRPCVTSNVLTAMSMGNVPGACCMAFLNLAPGTNTHYPTWKVTPTGPELQYIMQRARNMLAYCQMDHWIKLQRNLIRNSNVFIRETALENVVCQMTTISSQS